MYDTLYKLGLYIHTHSRKLRSHYFRNRSLLKKKCQSFEATPEFTSEAHQRVLMASEVHGSCLESDFESHSEKSVLQEWMNRFPDDPRFYRMLRQQMNLWKAFGDKTVEEFLRSREGVQWLQRRKKLKRRPTFELDRTFRASKQAALLYERKVQRLIRENPLLRWEDLKTMGIKNAQKIVGRFTPMKNLRKKFLRELSRNFSLLE